MSHTSPLCTRAPLAPASDSKQNPSLAGFADPWLLVFDLDGTLIDSSADLCRSVNAALAHVGKAPLPEATVASFIGDGAAALVRRSLAASSPRPESPRASDSLFAEAFPHFLNFYREHKLDNTVVYPGVLESLAEIRSRHPDLLMAVLTNKPVHPSREICAALGLAPFFFANYGGNSFATKKPEPEGLLRLLQEGQNTLRGTRAADLLTPARAVMIGDTDVDVRTARACGLRALGCAYGLAPGALAQAKPDWTVQSARDWASTLGL